MSLGIICSHTFVTHLNSMFAQQALVEHYSAAGQPEVVEQAVLHMDVASLDLNQVSSSASPWLASTRDVGPVTVTTPHLDTLVMCSTLEQQLSSVLVH